MRCSNTAGPQLLLHCWLTRAPGTLGKMALGTRLNSAEGQAAQPRAYVCNIPNQALARNNSAASELCPQQGHNWGSKLLWCPGCFGSGWQAHGSPLPGAQTCSALSDELAEEKTFFTSLMAHSLCNKAARLFCPKAMLYTALRSHTGSGQTWVHQVRSLWILSS